MNNDNIINKHTFKANEEYIHEKIHFFSINEKYILSVIKYVT